MKIVEATLTVPLTILIMVSLIGLMMTFYSSLTDQVAEHDAYRAKTYETPEA